MSDIPILSKTDGGYRLRGGLWRPPSKPLPSAPEFAAPDAYYECWHCQGTIHVRMLSLEIKGDGMGYPVQEAEHERTPGRDAPEPECMEATRRWWQWHADNNAIAVTFPDEPTDPFPVGAAW